MKRNNFIRTMTSLRCFVIVLVFLPVVISFENSTEHKNLETNLGLRPVFEQLLGAKAIDDYVAHAWKRSLTEVHHTPSSTKPNRSGKKKHYSNDIFAYGPQRFDALGPVLQCPRSILSVFGKGDGEKHICGLRASLDRDSTNAASGSGANKHKSCVIISVGGQNRWDFELSIARALPHCHIHTLDCTVYGLIPDELKKHVTFHKVCIATENNNITGVVYNGTSEIQMDMQFMRWTDFTTTIGLTEPPDVMKMDIEGFEWSVLTDLAASTPRHLLPRSISLELHYESSMTTLPLWNRRLRGPFEIGSWMDFMFTRGNYVLVDRNDNSHCPHCSEIVIAHIPFSKPGKGHGRR